MLVDKKSNNRPNYPTIETLGNLNEKYERKQDKIVSASIQSKVNSKKSRLTSFNIPLKP